MFSARSQHPTKICVRGHRGSLEAALLQRALGAARAHDEQMHRAMMADGVVDLAKHHARTDRKLQEAVSGIRGRLAEYIEPEAVCFEAEMIRPLLEGRKTVARWPIETTTEEESLPAPFAVSGGPGGSYAVQELSADGASVDRIDGYRVQVLSVGMDVAHGLHLDEVLEEGFESREAHKLYWTNIHLKNNLYSWVRARGLLVWRYEIRLFWV